MYLCRCGSLSGRCVELSRNLSLQDVDWVIVAAMSEAGDEVDEYRRQIARIIREGAFDILFLCAPSKQEGKSVLGPRPSVLRVIFQYICPTTVADWNNEHYLYNTKVYGSNVKLINMKK